jgi:hypothetical protein
MLPMLANSGKITSCTYYSASSTLSELYKIIVHYFLSGIPKSFFEVSLNKCYCALIGFKIGSNIV